MKYLMTIVFALAISACGGKKDEPKPAPPPPAGSAAMTGSGSAAAMTGSAGSAPPAAATIDVPTEMDFEQEAKTAITDKNVDTQVKKIEADLGSGR